MKKVAVILSGCGVFDGAEIHESVFTLLSLAQQGASYQCFAPDVEQLHVINHLSGEVEENQSRNVLVESARIARGDVLPLSQCDAVDFDALILPGGFGAAKNLCTFALSGPEGEINQEVLAVCKQFAEQQKPAAYACIAPAIAAMVYEQEVKLTIGNDSDTAAGLNALGASHVNCAVDDIVVDSDAKVVTTPAYMLADNIVDAHKSIERMVSALLALK